METSLKNKYSDYKIFFKQEKINSFLEGKIIAPPYVRIKPINLCNHGCFFCAYSTGFRVNDGGDLEHIETKMHENMKESDVIPTIKMLEILDDLAEFKVKAITYSGGGEPLMHKDIVLIMKRTLELGLDLSIITNGQNLAKERAEVLANAKWVRISIDYSNSEQFNKFRNVPEKGFNSIISNIKSFSKIKNNDCDLSVNFIVHKNNYSNLLDIAEILKDAGVENIRFSPMYVPDFFDYHKDIKSTVDAELSKISKICNSSFTVNSTYKIEEIGRHSSFRKYSRCYAMEMVPVIGADLNVYTCHNKAYDSNGNIGNIRERKFSEFWSSPETSKFIKDFNPKLKCMHECTADNKNNIINDFINTNPDNFI